MMEVRPNVEELLSQKSFISKQSLAVPGLMMQMTRLSINRMSSIDFSKASQNVRNRARSVA